MANNPNSQIERRRQSPNRVWLTLILVLVVSSIIVIHNYKTPPEEALNLEISPVPGKDIAFVTFRVEPLQEETNLRLPSGTIIGVPDHSFVDQSGGIVQEEVILKFREFHNAADVLLSGIPMSIDSAGRKGHLQTIQ